jgi:hypothetical protein
MKTSVRPRRKKRTGARGAIRPFTGPDLQELESLLCCSRQFAVIAALTVEEIVERMRLSEELEKRVDAPTEIRRLNRVAGGAEYVAKHLARVQPYQADPLVRALNARGIPTRDVAGLVPLLTHISQAARDLVADPSAYRKLIGLRDRSENAASLERRILWPALFRLWYRVHGELKLSEEGPLVRFIKLAQRHAGFEDDLTYGTLRSAREVLEPEIEAFLANEEATWDRTRSVEAQERARELRNLAELYPDVKRDE